MQHPLFRRVLGHSDPSQKTMMERKPWIRPGEGPAGPARDGPMLEIMFTKGKYGALSVNMKAIIENAVEAASQDRSYKAVSRYSKDYIEMRTKNEVNEHGAE